MAVALTLNGAALMSCEKATPRQSERECCRYCSEGKACGDSCIGKRFKCHKPRGCACNFSD